MIWGFEMPCRHCQATAMLRRFLFVTAIWCVQAFKSMQHMKGHFTSPMWCTGCFGLWILQHGEWLVIILCMRPANERRRCIGTSSLIGWAHTWNDPWWSTSWEIFVLFIANEWPYCSVWRVYMVGYFCIHFSHVWSVMVCDTYRNNYNYWSFSGSPGTKKTNKQKFQITLRVCDILHSIFNSFTSLSHSNA